MTGFILAAVTITVALSAENCRARSGLLISSAISACAIGTGDTLRTVPISASFPAPSLARSLRMWTVTVEVSM